VNTKAPQITNITTKWLLAYMTSFSTAQFGYDQTMFYLLNK